MKIDELIKTFNSDQYQMFKLLLEKFKYQFRVPTGVGKGYVMILHILYTIIKTDYSKLAIASHRLSLNNQHLRDIINFSIKLGLIGKVKFLTIGSQSLNVSKLLRDDYKLAKRFNDSLFEYNFDKDKRKRLNEDDIFQGSLSTKDITKIIKKNDSDGFKTIIVTTYNSLDKLKNTKLDILYCDEAHILASNKEEADFKKSYEVVDSIKRFFFTATPKDVEEQILQEENTSDIFLMNNKEIFGDIFQIPFIRCVQQGYITKPVIHVAHPKDFQDGTNYDSIENKSRFVKDTFEVHERWLKSVSCSPDDIEPKVLVRCESVPHMWQMYFKMSEIMPSDVTICAGASYNDFGGDANHVIGNDWERNRDEFVKKIQNVPDNRKMIILQFDIFSEGINVPGITGVLFLQGKMPSLPKVIQNVGRSTRLHKIDRSKIFSGDLTTNEYDKWVKPYCAVIIPYWDSRSEFTKNILASTIKKLRDSWEFDPHFVLSIGDDFAESDKNDDEEGLNNPDKKSKKSKLIEEIQNEIEVLDNNESELERQNMINEMDMETWFKYANNIE